MKTGNTIAAALLALAEADTRADEFSGPVQWRCHVHTRLTLPTDPLCPALFTWDCTDDEPLMFFSRLIQIEEGGQTWGPALEDIGAALMIDEHYKGRYLYILERA